MAQPTATKRRPLLPDQAKTKDALVPASTDATGAPPPPAFNWKNLSYIAIPIVLLWGLAIYSGSKVFMIVLGVLTALIVGFLAYAFYWARKQRNLMEILQSANISPEARKEALAKLDAQSGGNKDVMNLIAKAQLQAQDDPDAALATLEAIDLKKVPSMLIDEVRASRAQLYLMMNRTREARELADDIKVKDAQTAESRGVMAAIVGEAWARTGKHKEALDLFQNIKPESADYAKTKVPMLIARIFAAFADGQRDTVRRDMQTLMREKVDYLGRFLNPKFKVHPELQKIAKDLLARDPEVRKMAQKQQRTMRRMR